MIFQYVTRKIHRCSFGGETVLKLNVSVSGEIYLSVDCSYIKVLFEDDLLQL